MGALKTVVHNGRVFIDRKTKLPEGTVLELNVVDPGDELSTAERSALHRSIRRAQKQVREGHSISGAELLRKLRQPR